MNRPAPASTQTESRGFRAQRLSEALRRATRLRRSIRRSRLWCRGEQDVTRRARLRERQCRLKIRLCILQVEIACMYFLESESEGLDEPTTDGDL